MDWKNDILGDGFEMTHVNQGNDYAGKVRCSVIRRKTAAKTTRGVLYIHGFSDYFFQKEMAMEYVDHGYDFYAVDLRRYGRSLQEGDKMFRVKNLREYFADIQAGVDIMKADGITEIILIGHSTGGLSTSLYMMEAPDPAIKGLILNSPFLTWNLSPAAIKLGIPVLKRIARFHPKFRVKGDGTNKYAATLARHLGGEWVYNTNWKPDIMPDVDAEWIKAIDDAQQGLKQGEIKVPVLFLHSDKSAKAGDSMEQYKTSDAVLNVKTMAATGRKLGKNVTEVIIPNGLHDLVLSKPSVRKSVFTAIFNWLDKTFPNPKAK